MKVKDDVIVKGFDPVVVRKLLAYVRPYLLTTVIALIALLVSIAAELATPVVMQRTIDTSIMSGYLFYAGPSSPDDAVPAAVRLLEQHGNIPAGQGWLIPNRNFGVLSAREKTGLLEAGYLGSEEWYVTDRDGLISVPPELPGDSLVAAVGANPGLFVSLEELAGEESSPGYVIRTDDLSLLDRDTLHTIRSQDREGISRYVRFFLFLTIGSLAFTFLQIYLMAVTGQNVMRDIRLHLLDHLVHQSLAYLQKTPVGSLVSRLTSDVDTINELFTSVAISFIRDLVVMAGVIVAMFFLNARLARLVMLTLPPILVATLFFRVRAREVYRRVRMWISRVNAFLSEHISGMDVVQMFGREKLSGSEFDTHNRGMMKAQLSEMFVFAVFRPLIDLFSSVSIAVVLYFGASMFFDHTVTLGVLFAFINLIQMFYRPVMDLSEKFTIMQSAMAGGERIFDILDTRCVIESQGEAVASSDIRGDIRFENVRFAYNEDEPVLKDISFDIRAGETIAIVGYTGAGKTTIANLLTRFWDIQEGQILIDGRSVRDFDLESLRRTVMPVQQDVFMFSGTIRDNIALGSGMSDEQVTAAARTVFAHDFIMKLPDGYATQIMERGSNLSTGQKQLISFARVIAHDPRIMILDEATGSIDTETEKMVQNALGVLLEGRTSIVIAHRLSTIRYADRIMALAGGKLVESGSHEELLEKKGLYYNLYLLQYRQDERP